MAPPPVDPARRRESGAFEDLCRDFTAVNRYVADLRLALEAVAATVSEDGEPEAGAKARPELRDPKRDALLQQHAGPYEQRAKKALGEGGG